MVVSQRTAAIQSNGGETSCTNPPSAVNYPPNCLWNPLSSLSPCTASVFRDLYQLSSLVSGPLVSHCFHSVPTRPSEIFLKLILPSLTGSAIAGNIVPLPAENKDDKWSYSDGSVYQCGWTGCLWLECAFNSQCPALLLIKYFKYDNTPLPKLLEWLNKKALRAKVPCSQPDYSLSLDPTTQEASPGGFAQVWVFMLQRDLFICFIIVFILEIDIFKQLCISSPFVFQSWCISSLFTVEHFRCLFMVPRVLDKIYCNAFGLYFTIPTNTNSPKLFYPVAFSMWGETNLEC